MSRIITKQDLFALVFLTALTIIILTGTAFITQSQNEVLLDGPTTQCSDQIDNDGDGYIDLLDLGCENEEDDAENSEGSDPGTDHCRQDFSQIDGNIVRNPYFACDELWQFGGNPPIQGNDSIPDYWGTQYPIGFWWVANSTTHEKKWLIDQTAPTPSKRVVLWHPKPEVLDEYPPFTHLDRKDGIAQFNETSFETGRWYKFECTFKTENVKPIFNQSGDYDHMLYLNSEHIGCELRLYDAQDNYQGTTITVNGPQGETWNDEYGIYTSWTGRSSDWITKTEYIFVPESTARAFFHITNYGLANLTVAKINFAPTACNCNERFPPFKKEGTIGFANFTGKKEFIIAYYGGPHQSGETLPISELNASGVNAIIKISGYHDGRVWDPNYYYHFDPDELEQYNMYSMDSTFSGAYRIDYEGYYIFNKTTIPPAFTGRNSPLNSDEKKSNFIGYWSDEPDCHFEGFLPELREFNWYKQRRYIDLFLAENKTPAVAYIDLCGGNKDNELHLEKWTQLSDVISFSQNFQPYGPDAYSIERLDDLGAIVRRIKDYTETTHGKNLPIWALPSVEISWAPQSWKNQDNTINFTLLRFQIYNQIANGASGVHWFPINGIDLDNPTDYKIYQQVQQLNFELNTIKGVLNEEQFHEVWSSSEYLEIMAKKHNDKWYLIATNPSHLSKPDTTIYLNRIGTPITIKALFEDSAGTYNNTKNRTITFQGLQFSDDFVPYDTHIYEIEVEETCGDGTCSAGETKQTCPLDCSWPKFTTKTKAIFEAEKGTTYTNESRIDYYLSLGINTIISHSNGELRISYYNFSKYNDTFMPPVLTNFSNFSYSKGFRYYPGIAWTFNASQPSYYINEGRFEKAVLSNGLELDEVSPLSEDYWNNQTEILVRLAKYGMSNGSNIDGVWFDFELYTVAGGSYVNDSWGFENSTWWEFLETINVTDPLIVNLSYDQRVWWLVAWGHLDNYRSFLHNLMFTRARNMKDKVMAINPNFLIGAYPSPKSETWRKYLDDIYSGWSYPDSPTVVWATDSYSGGGINNVPRTINSSVLINNAYYNLTPTYNKSMYGYYTAGLLIGSSWYGSNVFTSRVTPMANATNGYWIWQAQVINQKCEDLVAPKIYETRLPTNCANDQRNPGCCINNRLLNDAQWLNECCPYYPQTVAELWQAINETNYQLSLQEQNQTQNLTLPLIYPRFEFLTPFLIEIDNSNGEMNISVNGKKINLETFFSHPFEGQLNPTDGFVHFSKLRPDSTWHVTVTRQGENYTITGEGNYYKVIRTINVTQSKAYIFDYYENKLDEDVGIPFRFDIYNLSAQEAWQGFLYSGRNGSMMRGNPTALIYFENESIGMLFDDNILRAQITTGWDSVNNQHMNIRNDYFGLPARGNYTFEWVIYPLATTDYYDFINIIRKEQNSNYEIKNNIFLGKPAPNNWMLLNDSARRELFEQGNIYSASTHLWTKGSNTTRYAHGPDIWEDFRPGIDILIEDMKRNLTSTGLDIKYLLYVNFYLYSGHNATSLYSDSRTINITGNHVQLTNASYIYGFFPTKNNSFGIKMQEFVPEIIDRFNATGIYIDESSYSISDFTYNESYWDGFSFYTNWTTGDIIKRIGSTILLSDDYKITFVQNTLQRGMYVVANQPPVTKEFSAIKIPHFREIKSNPITFPEIASQTHLSSPIVLSTSGETNDTRFIQSALDYGALHYPHYHLETFYKKSDLYKRMYPFTPIALYSGTLIGENQTITNRVGYFGWNDNSQLTIYYYNYSGDPQTHNFSTIIINGKTFAEIYENNGIVIIERIKMIETPEPPHGEEESEGGDEGPGDQCIPNWQCSDWSECIDNTQTRTCGDENHCDTLAGKPETLQSCNPDQLVGPGDQENQDQNQEDQQSILGINLAKVFVYSLFGILIITIILVTITLIKFIEHKNE
jgi:hypothetical protein